MITFLTVGFVIFFSVPVSSQQCDVPPKSIRSMEPSFGGIGPFYSIAKGISDGLQSTPDSKTYNDLNNLIFGNGAVTYDQVITDMVVNQIGAIIFWSIGFVFVLAALVLGIATCIWQCCFTCVPKEGSVRSNITGYVYASLLVVTFSFVLTGLVLFNISESDLVDSIDNGLVYTKEISSDLNSVISNGTGQLTCEVGTTTNRTFGQMNELIQSYSDVVVNGTSQQVGLTAVNQFDHAGFEKQNTGTINAAITLNTKIASLPNTGDQTCQTNKQTLQNQIPQVQTALTGLSTAANQVVNDPDLININKNIASIKQQIQTQANDASASLTSSQKSIADSMNSITNMLNSVQSDINNVVNSLEAGHRDITTSSSYTVIKIVLRLLVTVPACIGCVFMILAFVAIVLSLRQQNELVQKMATAVLSTFYTSISLSIVLLLLSSLAFVGGWFMSAMCVPIFEDPSYQLFHLMNQTVSPINNGTPTVVNIGDVLQTCTNSDATIYTACNGSNIISADSINQQLNLDSYRNEANQQIQSQPKSTYPDPTQYQSLLDTLNNGLNAAKAASLQSCNDNGANDNYNEYIANFQKSVEWSNTFVNNLKELSQKAPQVNDIAEQQNNNQFNTGEANINQSVAQLMSNLSTNIFKCSPFVDIYHNGGFVMCEQFGKPIQGLWASIGLAGIFLFFLAILLLLIFRWLKTGTGESQVPFATSPVDMNVNGNETKSDSKKENRRLGKPSSEEANMFGNPSLTSKNRLPRIRPYEMDEQLTTPPYFSDVDSNPMYPRVQVLPDSRHPPMSPNYYDTQQSGPRLARFDDIDLFGDHNSYTGSTARGLRRF